MSSTSRSLEMDGLVDLRPRKEESVIQPNTATKRWASEIRLTGLESAKEAKQQGEPSNLQALPTVMHFGGYELNKVQSQKLRVVNKSLDTIRLTVLKPTTPFFQLKWEKNKPGFLAPGMALAVHVQFAPTEWRYYYDCVRINCGDEKILVPIHAYPIMNQAVFPKRFDVGKARLGTTKKRAIKLKCTAPIAFEFEVKFIKEHYDFKVSPARGIVPANGEVPVVIEYTPTKLSTTECSIMLNIAQFNYQPFETTITGSGVTDFVSDVGEDDDRPAAFGTTNKSKAKTVTRQADPGLPAIPKAVGAGAVRDAGAEFAATMNRSRALKAVRRKQLAAKANGPPPDYAAVSDGIRVPHRLQDGHHMVNFVLTQQKGKLKPKDLKKAVEEQRREREAQEAALRAASALHSPEADQGLESKTSAGHIPRKPPERYRGPGSGPSLSHPTIIAEVQARGRETQPPQIREATYIRAMNAIETEEKQREFKSAPVLGEPLMSQEELDSVQEARAQREIELGIVARTVDRARIETESLGPYQDPPSHCPVPLEEVPKLQEDPQFKPQFNQYVNDTWRMRSRVVKKFVGSVTKFIVRRRIDERLAAIKKRLGVAATTGTITKEAVAALVEEDQTSRGAGTGDSKATDRKAPATASDGSVLSDEEAKALKAHMAAVAAARAQPVQIQFERFYERNSQYDADGATSAAPMGPAALPTYHNLQYLPLAVPKEYELAGYVEDSMPPFQTYVPSEVDRELLVGAIEEESFRPTKTLAELDLSEQSQLARVQHERYVEAEERAQAKLAFAKYDADGSGSIDSHEMAKVLMDLGLLDLGADDPILRSVMDSADVDDDGEVSFNEFLIFFRKCLAARNTAAAAAGDASKRLDLTFFHPKAQPTALPVQLSERLRAKRVFHTLPPADELEFRPEHDLRPVLVGPTVPHPLANEPAQVLVDAERGFLCHEHRTERAPFELLPMFFQSPADCIAEGEFASNIDLVPWRASRAQWQLATPGGLTTAIEGCTDDSIAAVPVLRPELLVAHEGEQRTKLDTSIEYFAGVRPGELLLKEPQSDDDLSDSDTDSEDEWGLPLRPNRDMLLTPAVARHFCEELSFEAIYARELELERQDFADKVAVKVSGTAVPPSEGQPTSSTRAAEVIAAAVSERAISLDAEIKQTTEAAAAVLEGGDQALQAARESVVAAMVSQPRTVGSVYGRELRTDVDGPAPTIVEQYASPKLIVHAADDTAVVGDDESRPVETEEEHDERMARERAFQLARLARDTHRDLRWTNRNHPDFPQQQFSRDSALVKIADSIERERTPLFDTLPQAVAEFTKDAVDPLLRVQL